MQGPEVWDAAAYIHYMCMTHSVLHRRRRGRRSLEIDRYNRYISSPCNVVEIATVGMDALEGSLWHASAFRSCLSFAKCSGRSRRSNGSHREPWHRAYEGDMHFEITPLDVISNGIKAALGSQKIEYNRAVVKCLHELRTPLEKEI